MTWYVFTREKAQGFSRIHREPIIEKGWFVEGLFPGEVVVMETDHIWFYYRPPWDAPPDPTSSYEILAKKLPGRILPAFIKAVFEADLNEEP
jgi:hypothetical protein